jgi:hypothetical protein
MGRTEWLKAGVQYGDWHGTAAADNSDFEMTVHGYLEKKNLIKPGEFLLAVQLYSGSENQNKKLEEPYIRAYLLADAGDFKAAKARLDELEAAGEPIPVREVEINVPLGEFVSWFKRFSVVFTARDLPLTDRECNVTENYD